MPQIPPITDQYVDDVIKSSGPYVENINLTQGVKLRELVKTLRDYFEQEIPEFTSQLVNDSSYITEMMLNGFPTEGGIRKPFIVKPFTDWNPNEIYGIGIQPLHTMLIATNVLAGKANVIQIKISDGVTAFKDLKNLISEGIIIGGTTGQTIAKNSNINGDAIWVDVPNKIQERLNDKQDIITVSGALKKTNNNITINDHPILEGSVLITSAGSLTVETGSYNGGISHREANSGNMVTMRAGGNATGNTADFKSSAGISAYVFDKPVTGAVLSFFKGLFGTTTEKQAHISVGVNTPSTGQINLAPSAADYVGNEEGTIWNNNGEIKAITNGIVNRALKVYGNELFKSDGNYMAEFNQFGDLSAVSKIREHYVYDTDIITAITDATYIDNEASINLPGKTLYIGQKYYDGEFWRYEAVGENTVIRIPKTATVILSITDQVQWNIEGDGLFKGYASGIVYGSNLNFPIRKGARRIKLNMTGLLFTNSITLGNSLTINMEVVTNGVISYTRQLAYHELTGTSGSYSKGINLSGEYILKDGLYFAFGDYPYSFADDFDHIRLVFNTENPTIKMSQANIGVNLEY
jgi:hypothetical protein